MFGLLLVRWPSVPGGEGSRSATAAGSTASRPSVSEPAIQSQPSYRDSSSCHASLNAPRGRVPCLGMWWVRALEVRRECVPAKLLVYVSTASPMREDRVVRGVRLRRGSTCGRDLRLAPCKSAAHAIMLRVLPRRFGRRRYCGRSDKGTRLAEMGSACRRTYRAEQSVNSGCSDVPV